MRKAAVPSLRRTHCRVHSDDGKLLLHRDATFDAAMDDVTHALSLDLSPLLGDTTVFVHLALHGTEGALVSQNSRWRAASDSGYRAPVHMAAADLTLSARDITSAKDAPERRLEVKLKNRSITFDLNAKLTTLDAVDGTEILPAFYSDNYISLMPGEERSVTIEMPGVTADRPLKVTVDGWNIGQRSIESDQIMSPHTASK